MAKPYLAHGKCGECGFVGDMWFAIEGHDDKEAMCPDCMCVTHLDAMPEFPGA